MRSLLSSKIITRALLYEELKRKRNINKPVEATRISTKLTDKLDLPKGIVEYSIDTPDDIHLEGLFSNIVLTNETFEKSIMTSDDQKLRKAQEIIYINKTSKVGDNDAGKTYGGDPEKGTEDFVLSTCNEEDGNGCAVLAGKFGIEGIELPNVKAVCSGAPDSVKVTVEECVKVINENREENAKTLDALPAVFGAPSGGFLGTLFRVVGAFGAIGQFADAASPLGRLAGQVRNLRDTVFDATGISALIDQVETAFQRAQTFVDDTIDTVIGGIEEAMTDIQTSIQNASADFAGRYSISEAGSGSVLADTVHVSTGMDIPPGFEGTGYGDTSAFGLGISDPNATAVPTAAAWADATQYGPPSLVLGRGDQGSFDIATLGGGQRFDQNTFNVIGANGLIVTSQSFTESGGSIFGAFLRDVGENALEFGRAQIQNIVAGTLTSSEVGQYLSQLASGDYAIVETTILGIVNNNLGTDVGDLANAVLTTGVAQKLTREQIFDRLVALGVPSADIEKIKDELAEIELKIANAGLNEPVGEIFSTEDGQFETPDPTEYDKFSVVQNEGELAAELSERFKEGEGFRTIDNMIIHATDSFSNHNLDANMINYAFEINGKKDGIQYHYVIKRDGTIQRGKTLSEVGEHTGIDGVDKFSIGVVLVGGRSDTGENTPSFTQSQYSSLDSLIKQFSLYVPNGTYGVLGHNDVSDEHEDPYFDVKEYVSKFGQFPEVDPQQESSEDYGVYKPDLSVLNRSNTQFRPVYKEQIYLENVPVNPQQFKGNVASNLITLCQKMQIHLEVTSGFRSPEHNAKVPNSATQSPHITGLAADITWSFTNTEGKAEIMDIEQRKKLVNEAKILGFTGFGFYKGHLHIDKLSTKRCWGPTGKMQSLKGPDFAYAVEIMKDLGYTVIIK